MRCRPIFKVLLCLPLAAAITFATSCRSELADSKTGPDSSADYLPSATIAPVVASQTFVSTASELLDALASLGLACGTLTPQQAQPPELESFTCDGDRHLDVFTFGGAGDIDTWRRDVIGVLCASGIIGAELPIAIGERWAVAVEDGGVADSIAAQLGGAVVHAGDTCKAP